MTITTSQKMTLDISPNRLNWAVVVAEEIWGIVKKASACTLNVCPDALIAFKLLAAALKDKLRLAPTSSPVHMIISPKTVVNTRPSIYNSFWTDDHMDWTARGCKS